MIHPHGSADAASSFVLDHLAQTLQTAQSTEDLVRPMLELIAGVTGLESTYLTSVDMAGQRQTVEYSRNTGLLQIPETLTVDWADTLCSRALNQDVGWCDDVSTRWHDSAAARALGIETYISTPVRLAGGELYGTLCGASAQRMPLSDASARLLGMFAHLIGQHIERERLLQRLQQAYIALDRSAHQDPLTGLPNRRAILEALVRRIARSAQDGSNVMVAFIDLDGLKVINDSHGHLVGDLFLGAVATALSAGLRAGEMLGRLGGDEFLLIADRGNLDAVTAIPALLERLDQQLHRSFIVDDIRIEYQGASIGVVAASNGEDAAALISRADAAMYAMKQARKRL